MCEKYRRCALVCVKPEWQQNDRWLLGFLFSSTTTNHTEVILMCVDVVVSYLPGRCSTSRESFLFQVQVLRQHCARGASRENILSQSINGYVSIYWPLNQALHLKVKLLLVGLIPQHYYILPAYGWRCGWDSNVISKTSCHLNFVWFVIVLTFGSLATLSKGQKILNVLCI